MMCRLAVGSKPHEPHPAAAERRGPFLFGGKRPGACEQGFDSGVMSASAELEKRESE